MLKALVWSVALLTASTAVGQQITRPVTKRPPMPKVTVVMTAATLADDCGGTAPFGAPAAAPAPAPITASAPASPPRSITKADSEMEDPALKAKGARARRRCEQTSMQLSATAARGSAATKIKVKKVELFDENGTSLGELTSTTPRVWSATKGQYEAWNESIAAGQTLNLSYVLSQPAWGPANRHNKTYTLKATVTVGTNAQTVSKDVQISAPTILPPNVKT